MMRLRKTANVMSGISLQNNSDRGFAIEREVVANRDAPARTKREILAHAIFLSEEFVKLVFFRKWVDRMLVAEIDSQSEFRPTPRSSLPCYVRPTEFCVER